MLLFGKLLKGKQPEGELQYELLKKPLPKKEKRLFGN